MEASSTTDPQSNRESKRSQPQSRASLFPNFPILYSYVYREVLSPFWVSLFVFTGILFLARILKLVDLVVNKNVPVTDTLVLFSYVIPSFLEIAMPMALLIGILLAFGRLSSDSELIVIRASGISLTQLAKPVLCFAAITFVFATALGFWIRPWANYRLGLGIFEIVKLKASAGLSPGVFNDFGPLTIYAESVDDQTGRLHNVLIADRRDPEMNRNFLARYGQILSDNEHRSLSLQLYDGSIQEGSGLNFTVTSFEINKIKLPESELLEDNASREGKHANEMYLGELWTAIQTYQNLPKTAPKEEFLQLARYRVELQRRLVIPCSCFCVALAALALGVQPSRGGRSWGASANITLGIALILIYYLLLALGSALGSQALAPVWLVMWIPNVVFALLGWYWFRQIGNERWSAVSQTLGDFLDRISKRFGLSSAQPATEQK